MAHKMSMKMFMLLVVLGGLVLLAVIRVLLPASAEELTTEPEAVAASVQPAEPGAGGKYTYDEVFDVLIDATGADHAIVSDSDYEHELTVSNGRVQVIDVEGESFTKAFRATVTNVGNSVWSTQSFIPLHFDSGLETGDIVFISYKMRGVRSYDESGLVTLNGIVRSNLGPGGSNPLVNGVADTNGEWTQIFGAGRVPRPSDGQQPYFAIHFAFHEQIVDIADIQVINFGKSVSIDQLPVMEVTYDGREEDAPWRVEAEARIEALRKADLEVQVVDAQGNPVSDAEVSIRQLNHEFGFGGILNVNALTGPQATAYKEAALMLNAGKSGFANTFKWRHMESTAVQREAAMQWTRDNNIALRGHTLIWGAWRRIPDELVPVLQADPALLRAATLQRVTDTVTEFKGQVWAWDVVNEPFSSKDFTQILGDGIMVEWFDAAHQADPDVKLFLNDYGLLVDDRGHQDYTYDVLEYLIDNDAPIHGLGMQGHFKRPVAPTRMLEILDRFAALGLDIEITEFTYDTADEELQADFWRDVMTVVFSHPSTIGLYTWGFWEGQMTDPIAAMVRRDFTLKPNGEVWRDLIFNQWWTEESGTVNENGVYEARGFKGDYEITVNRNGQEWTQRVKLDGEGATVTVGLTNE